MNLIHIRPASVFAAAALALTGCVDVEQGAAAAKADSAAAAVPGIAADSAGGLVGAATGSTGASPVFVPQSAAPAQPPADSVVAAPKAGPAPQVPPVPPVPEAVKGAVGNVAVSDYRLTMDRIRQMRQAGLNLAALQRERPDLAKSMQMEGPPDPNRVHERLNSVPEAKAAVERAGLSTRDYALGMGALMQGMIVHRMRKAGMNPPMQADPENLEFIAEHETEIMQLLSSAAAEAGATLPTRP